LDLGLRLGRPAASPLSPLLLVEEVIVLVVELVSESEQLGPVAVGVGATAGWLFRGRPRLRAATTGRLASVWTGLPVAGSLVTWATIKLWVGLGLAKISMAGGGGGGGSDCWLLSNMENKRLTDPGVDEDEAAAPAAADVDVDAPVGPDELRLGFESMRASIWILCALRFLLSKSRTSNLIIFLRELRRHSFRPPSASSGGVGEACASMGG